MEQNSPYLVYLERETEIETETDTLIQWLVAHLGSRASLGAKVSGLYGTLIWGDGLLPDAPQQTEACHLLPQAQHWATERKIRTSLRRRLGTGVLTWGLPPLDSSSAPSWGLLLRVGRKKPPASSFDPLASREDGSSIGKMEG